MLSLIEHRGPDQFGFLECDGSFYASARLSIVDLANGGQPLSNEDETIWTVFNGELYDDDLIREDLAAKGHRFRTRSDTELLVHLYEEYDDRLNDYLNGEYAYCIIDLPKRRTLLARDPFGTRPLFVKRLAHGAVLFSSEIKPLLWAPRQYQARVSATALAQVLESWAPIPPATSFEGIEQIQPGRVGICDTTGGLKIHAHTGLIKPAECRESLSIAPLIETAVRRRLRGDVPAGVYLSGGLDSAIVAMLAAKNSSHKLSSFSIGFENRQFDESADQEVISSALGTEHHSIRISSSELVENFVPAVLAAECIVFRTAFVPMFMLSRLVHERGIKVVLTGEGADELFGGYDIFREYRLLRDWSRSPDSAAAFEDAFSELYPYLPEFRPENRRVMMAYYQSFLPKVNEAFAGHASRWAGYTSTKLLLKDPPGGSPTRTALEEDTTLLELGDPLEISRHTEILTLLHGYLLSTQGDRMASAHSVEVRLPFLDKDVYSYALRRPVESFLTQRRGKDVLYKAFARELPAAPLVKPKTPFLAPDAEAFFTAGSAWRDFMSEASLDAAGIFNTPNVLKLVRRIEESLQANRNLSRKDNSAFFAILSASILFHAIRARLEPKPLRLSKIVRLTRASVGGK